MMRLGLFRFLTVCYDGIVLFGYYYFPWPPRWNWWTFEIKEAFIISAIHFLNTCLGIWAILWACEMNRPLRDHVQSITIRLKSWRSFYTQTRQTTPENKLRGHNMCSGHTGIIESYMYFGGWWGQSQNGINLVHVLLSWRRKKGATQKYKKKKKKEEGS